MSNWCTDFLLEEFVVAPNVIPIHKSKSLYDPHKMIIVDNSKNGKDCVSYQLLVKYWVKIPGHWPSLCKFMDLNFILVHKHK